VKTLPAILTAASLSLSAGMPALAQGQRLTLKDAVRDAVATSGSVQAAEAKIQGAQARIDEAGTRTKPTVSVSVLPIHLGILDPGIQGLLNAFAPGMSPNLLAENLTVSQVLYEGGRVQLGARAAEIGKELASEGARQSRQQVAYNAAIAYLGVLRAESLLRAVLLSEQQGHEHLKDALLREKTGAGAHFDTLQAQTALANTEQRVIQARNAVRLARLSLGTAIHQPLGNQPLDPAPSLPIVTADDAAIMRGLSRRPEVRMATRQRDLDRLTTEITSRESLPVVAAQGIVAGNGTQMPAYILMGSLSWTVFDGGKTDAQVRQGEKSIEADEANLSALQDGLRLEVQKAIADREEARERILAAEQGLKTAQAGFDLSRIRYSEGAGTGTEVLDATTALSQAQAGYIQATYDELTAELNLAKALGIDLPGLLS
jgi:outer membrane protein TolC